MKIRLTYILIYLIFIQPVSANDVYLEIWVSHNDKNLLEMYAEFWYLPENAETVNWYLDAEFKGSSDDTNEWSGTYAFIKSSLREGSRIYCVVETQNNRFRSSVYVIKTEDIQPQPVSTWLHLNYSPVAIDEVEPDRPIFCSGTTLDLSAATNGSSIKWYLNETLVSTSNTYSSSQFKTGDVITVEATGSTFVKKTIYPVFLSTEVPVVEIRYNTPDKCINEVIKFEASVSDNLSDPYYNPYYDWKKNGQSMKSGHGVSYGSFETMISSNDHVWLELTSNNKCASTNTVISNVFISSQKPLLRTEKGCDYLSIIVEKPESGYIYYLQESENSEKMDKPLSQSITQPGTYYVRGKNEYSWGCVSDPVNVIDIPQGISCGHNFIRERVVQESGITDISQITIENAQTSYMYYDDFGRSEQTTMMGVTPSGHDIVNFVTYDIFGREDKQYLPYEATSNDGSFRSDALSEQDRFYKNPPENVQGDARPWSHTVFEPSSLNRPIKQSGPGQAWETAGKHIATSYQANVLGEVRLWKKDGRILNGKAYYNPGTLYKTVVTDEDGNRSIVFTDLQEHIIRQDRMSGNTVVTTQYVYDDFGRPVYVIQPGYFDAANKPAYEMAEDDVAFSYWVFAYHYDDKGRVIEKHIPGGGWTSIVYNRADLPVMIQTAEQAGREWSFTKYDVHGRIVQTGVINSTEDRSDWQGKVDSGPLWEEYTNNGGIEGYTNRAQPGIAASHVMLVNYYDRYDFTGSEKWSGADDRVHGLLTGSRVRILDSNDWLVSTLSYDDKGRLVHSVSDNPKGGKDRVTNKYDFTGQLLSSRREHTGKEPVTLTTVNKYDHAGRLLTVKQHIGGDTITVASNSYNALGQLIQARHHENLSAGTAAETVNYDYNIRGWLTSIDGDLFKEKLHYQDPAGTFGNLVQGQWGGNISSVEWYTPRMNKYWHMYGYSYNEQGFLTNSRYARSNALSNNSTYNTNKNHNDEWYAYDLNGNVRTLNRKHLNRYIDQLSYTYDGNRLASLSDKTVIDPEKTNTGMIPITSLPAQGTYASCGGYEITGNFLMEGQISFEADPSLCDAGVTGSTSYNYDASGRMFKDIQSGVEIAYNHLNLVKQVKKDGKILKYTYDATGRKLKTTPPTGQPRTYISGIEYKGDAIEFISTPYGRIRKNGTNSWVYDYFLKDHLGNIRVVATTDPVNTQVYRATMEVNNSEEESQYFEKLDDTRSDRPYNYPDVNPANAKVAKVAGKSEGPKLTLKVMAGDTISISAQAFYNIDRTLPGQGADIVPVVGSAIAALAGGAMIPAGEAASLALDLGATASTSAALSQLPQDRQEDEGAQPESGLHFVLYNEQMDVVEANTGILPVDDRINRIQNLNSDRIIIQESGYLEVYVNNEAQTPVYYDNLMVMQSTGNVIEVNAYYPYGKIIQGLSTSSTYGKNNYKYNGKELQTDMELGWLDYGARMLDGPRWFVPDPLAEKYYSYSPYVYVGNNPINAFDPDGMDHYLVTDSGRVILALKTDDNYDRLYSSYTDRYGSGNIYISGGYIDVRDRSILSSLSDNTKTFENQKHLEDKGVMVEGNYAITKSGAEAKKVFKFAAKNSVVEWAVVGYKNGDWVVGTLNESTQAPNFIAIDGYYNAENTFYDEHSHGGTGPDDFWPSDPDMKSAAAIKQYNPTAEIWVYMPQNKGGLGKRAELPGPYDYVLKKYIYELDRRIALKRLGK